MHKSAESVIQEEHHSDTSSRVDWENVAPMASKDGEAKEKPSEGTEEKKGNKFSLPDQSKTLTQEQYNNRNLADIIDWLRPIQALGSRNKKEATGKETQEVDSSPDVKNIINLEIGPSEEVVVKEELRLTRVDFRSLKNKNYLNDKTIDHDLKLIEKRNETNDKLSDVYACTIFSLQAAGYPLFR